LGPLRLYFNRKLHQLDFRIAIPEALLRRFERHRVRLQRKQSLTGRKKPSDLKL